MSIELTELDHRGIDVETKNVNDAVETVASRSLSQSSSRQPGRINATASVERTLKRDDGVGLNISILVRRMVNDDPMVAKAEMRCVVQPHRHFIWRSLL